MVQITDYKDDLEYIDSRLRGTWVIYKNTFVKIISFSAAATCNIAVKTTLIEVPITELDINIPSLGYVDVGDSVTWMYRKAARHYKQGLNDFNCSGNTMFAIKKGNADQLLKGAYRNPYKSLELLCLGEIKKAALSPNFMMDDKNLYYRHHMVGKIQPNHDMGKVMFNIGKDFTFLHENLEEEIKNYG